MADSKKGGVSPATVDLFGGLLAGAVATLSTHPLDLAKTRMQTYLSMAPKGTVSAPTAISILGGLARSDRPLRNLYRGLNGTLLANALSQGSFFFFKSQFELALWDLKNRRQRNAVGATGSHAPTHLSPLDYFLTSSLAGITVQALTNPLWVLRTRMVTRDLAAEGAYPTLWAGVRDILRNEGFRGFYRGLGMGMLTVSHSGILFAVYEPGKRMLLDRRGRDEDRRLTNAETTVLSAVSKFAAGMVTFPMVTIRNRLQNNDTKQLYGRGAADVVANLWKQRGVRGFYAGLLPATIRVLPANVITLLVLENVRVYMPRLVTVADERNHGSP
ncbi:carrier protein flx1-like protein [Thozetella sp. PMI_491]|nr:carrier protein flx1-like protein [Thozetella sp. PMI_491]